jgi:EmrB/QacA subfamily drug resistance transporter
MRQPATPLDASAANAYKWKAFSVMALALFFGVMDFGGTGVAIPTIADDFSLALRKASWIAIGFALATSAALLPIGGFSDLLGRKRSFLAGGLIYAAGAVAAAVAPSFGPLLTARIFQAIGAALVMANGMATVAYVFPPEERGKGMGLITAFVGLGSLMGPIIAGGMVDITGWRSFFILLAAGSGVAVVWAWIVLDDEKIGGAPRGAIRDYDWAGAVLSVFALILLIMVVTNSDDLSTWELVSGILGTIFLFTLFIVREVKARLPMFALSPFKNGRFSWAISARFLGFVGTSSTFFLMPFYLQDVLNYDPWKVGLITFPGTLGFALMGFVSGRLSDKLGVRIFTVSGLVLVVVGTLMLATLDERSELYHIMPALLVSGFGMGLWIAPNMSVAISAVSSDTYGVISAFINLVRNTAGVVGVAIATAIVVGVIQHRGLSSDLTALGDLGNDPIAAATRAAFVDGMRIAFIVLAAVAAAAIVAAIKTRNPERLAAKGRSMTAPSFEGASPAQELITRHHVIRSTSHGGDPTGRA